MDLNHNIEILSEERIKHTKASEEYVFVRFTYGEKTEELYIPVEYRRTGLSIPADEPDEVISYLNSVYEEIRPEKRETWKQEQCELWDKENSGATVTRAIFDKLEPCEWVCSKHNFSDNTNFARRIQDIKEKGYTLSTDTRRYCPHCNSRTSHLMILPLKKGGITSGNGYETWSPALRKRIINLLGSIDVYENKANSYCLPDHKFPEIRWDEFTKSENPDSMTDEEIRAKFRFFTESSGMRDRN